jgi:hypothetical protein
MPGMARMPAAISVIKPPSLFPRGPKGTPQIEIPRPAFDPPPDTWPGTLPEWAIYWAHRTIGLPPTPMAGLWVYQASIGGGYNLGGVVLDFLEEDVRIGIQVQGAYWHYKKGNSTLKKDAISRAIITAFGLTPVFIDEQDALERPREILRDARMGIDRSLSARTQGY